MIRIKTLTEEVEKSSSRRYEDLLQQAQAEVEKLKENRVRQTEMVENIIRQRDTYKVLLSQAESKKLAAPPSAFIAASSVIDYPKLLADLQDEYDTYRKEKGDMETFLQQQLDKTREELSQTKVELSKSNTRSDMLHGVYPFFLLPLISMN